MPGETNEVEYRTVQIGGALLVKGILNRLDVVAAIDQALAYQPEIATTYGTLAQAVILNRMSLDPQPLYLLPEWVEEHGIDALLGIQADWLDDDRMGAMLEGLADHAVEIWSVILGKAVRDFRVELEWLHSDTTSVYFEGAYEDEPGEPAREEWAGVGPRVQQRWPSTERAVRVEPGHQSAGACVVSALGWKPE